MNRITTSGRVAAPQQRATVEEALRGVTIEAAYSLRLDDEIGTISPGKRANLTVLDANPLTVEPMEIRNIAVWGTVMEGRVLPAGPAERKASLEFPMKLEPESDFTVAALAHALKATHGRD